MKKNKPIPKNRTTFFTGEDLPVTKHDNYLRSAYDRGIAALNYRHWTSPTNVGDVTITSAILPNSSSPIPAFRGVCTIDEEPELISLVLCDGRYRSEWDKSYEKGNLVEIVDRCTAVTHFVLKAGWPSWPRDFLTVARSILLPHTDKYFTYSTSLDPNMTPVPAPSTVRANLIFSALLVSPLPKKHNSDTTKCEVIWIVLCDQNGVANSWMNGMAEVKSWMKKKIYLMNAWKRMIEIRVKACGYSEDEFDTDEEEDVSEYEWVTDDEQEEKYEQKNDQIKKSTITDVNDSQISTIQSPEISTSSISKLLDSSSSSQSSISAPSTSIITSNIHPKQQKQQQIIISQLQEIESEEKQSQYSPRAIPSPIQTISPLSSVKYQPKVLSIATASTSSPLHKSSSLPSSPTNLYSNSPPLLSSFHSSPNFYSSSESFSLLSPMQRKLRSAFYDATDLPNSSYDQSLTSAYNEGLKAFTSVAGWTHHSHSKGVDIYIQPSDKNSPTRTCKSVGVVHADAETITAYYKDRERRHEWDRLYDASDVIATVDRLTSLVYTSYKGIWPITSRDSVVVSRTCLLSSSPVPGTLYTYSTSTTHPSYPPFPHHIRATLLWSGLLVTPIKAGRCKVEFGMCSDLHGHLPVAVKNSAIIMNAGLISEFERIFKVKPKRIREMKEKVERLRLAYGYTRREGEPIQKEERDKENSEKEDEKEIMKEKLDLVGDASMYQRDVVIEEGDLTKPIEITDITSKDDCHLSLSLLDSPWPYCHTVPQVSVVREAAIKSANPPTQQKKKHNNDHNNDRITNRNRLSLGGSGPVHLVRLQNWRSSLIDEWEKEKKQQVMKKVLSFLWLLLIKLILFPFSIFKPNSEETEPVQVGVVWLQLLNILPYHVFPTQKNNHIISDSNDDEDSQTKMSNSSSSTYPIIVTFNDEVYTHACRTQVDSNGLLISPIQFSFRLFYPSASVHIAVYEDTKSLASSPHSTFSNSNIDGPGSYGLIGEAVIPVELLFAKKSQTKVEWFQAKKKKEILNKPYSIQAVCIHSYIARSPIADIVGEFNFHSPISSITAFPVTPAPIFIIPTISKDNINKTNGHFTNNPTDANLSSVKSIDKGTKNSEVTSESIAYACIRLQRASRPFIEYITAFYSLYEWKNVWSTLLLLISCIISAYIPRFCLFFTSATIIWLLLYERAERWWLESRAGSEEWDKEEKKKQEEIRLIAASIEAQQSNMTKQQKTVSKQLTFISTNDKIFSNICN